MRPKAPPRPQTRGPGSVHFSLAAALLVAGGGLLAGHVLMSSHVGVPSAQAAASERPAPPNSAAALAAQIAETFAATPVTVAIGKNTVALTWSELGATVDDEALTHAASVARKAVDASGSAPDLDAVRAALAEAGAMPVTVDRATAAKALEQLKARFDSAPRSAVMDLEQKTIHRERPGSVLDIYGSMGALATAAQSGADRVELSTVEIAPEVTVATLGIEDVSQVLAQFETKYSVTDAIRNFNLKLAASKLDGHVIEPGAEFSFNEVVGDRTEKEGYKVAGVIDAGEMVDGLAGGTCQISSTLHGAAFFAGLDLVKALPHSRPSTYITMGMDATVVYPNVDLVLKNPYDFPVAIHFRVTEGKAVVQILGRERPYDQIEFERRVIEQLEFDTVTREDESIPIGTMSIDQYGFFGYLLEKQRKFYKNGELVKRDKWKVRYQPVTEYVRNGVNPDPNLPPPPPDKDAKKKKRLQEPEKEIYRLAQ
ncbi:MAG TPA: VanW family protein [Haliangium sp.]|nr:VanW family protein [Haliangium sp.]